MKKIITASATATDIITAHQLISKYQTA